MSDGRWAGRNTTKDALRAEIWGRLKETGAGIGEVFSRIPNFVGAEEAASRLAAMPFWAEARIVKSNPDAPQIPVRRKALEDGKVVYTPIPELTKGFPFVELDPEDLARRGISFADAARSEIFVEIGKPMEFRQMKPMDLLVVGSVAVSREGGRTGKGAGFADLELGIFHQLGLVPPSAPLVTTVHDLQVAEAARLVIEAHDCPLDFVFTPSLTIETGSKAPRPQGVDWDFVKYDQYESIPFLKDLRLEMQKR
jgi:5-formyltetrahydrofolate cyclo-ligase